MSSSLSGGGGGGVVGVLKKTSRGGSVTTTTKQQQQFKPSHELQSKKSSFRSVVFATNDIIFNYNTTEPASSTTTTRNNNNKKRKNHDDDNVEVTDTVTTERTVGMASDASESKYWYDSFGLVGGSISQGTKLARRESTAKFAHPRAVQVDAASASVINEIHFHPTPGVDLTNKQQSTSSSLTGGLKPVSSNNCAMAVVAGPRVQLYGTTFDSTFHRTLSQHSTTIRTKSSISADKQVPTSGQLAISADFRSDGRLVAIGTDQGTIRITDCATRATITQFTNPSSYKLPIRSVRWFRDGQHLLSVGDDATLRIWQLKYTVGSISDDNNSGSGRPIIECIGHGDSIRCAVLWQLPDKVKNNNTTLPYPYTTLAATGSYDHTIRLWNLDDLHSTTAKIDRCVSILEHGSPVETVIWVSSGITNSATIPPVWLLSGGGTTIKVWNPMNGTCISTIETQHRKTITCLLAMPRIYGRSSSSEGSSTIDYRLRILSGGLDGFIRIHTLDRENGRVQFVHGIYDSQIVGGITSLAASPAADRIAIGTTKGTVLVRQKGPSIVPHKKLSEPRAGTFAFFTRGMNATPTSSSSDQIADNDSAGKKRKLMKHDIALKQFRYGDALDEAFATSRNPTIIVAVLEELGKRHGLRIALANRDESTLEPLLSFLIRYITNPKYSELLIGVTKMLLNIYGGSGTTSIIGHSDIIDELFKKLRMVIHKECRIQKSIFQVIGKMDAIMTAAEMDDLYTYRNK